MKNKINSKGFTLLELLVVILIIGILAAIALPQYRFTVGKSKYNNIKEIANNMAQAVERYYLAKTTPPENLDVLDIDTPTRTCSVTPCATTRTPPRTTLTTCPMN